jgi:DNA-binding NarL/FixJ family response regulator
MIIRWSSVAQEVRLRITRNSRWLEKLATAARSEKDSAAQARFVIMDISLPDLNGMDATCRQKAEPNTRVIIFTMHSTRSIVINLLKAGISGYF